MFPLYAFINKFSRKNLFAAGILEISSHYIFGHTINNLSYILDLGANKGDFYREMISRFNCKCHVVEPVPELFEQLPTNEKVTKYNYAITKRNGPVPFFTSHNPEAGSLDLRIAQTWGVENEICVPGITLESFLKIHDIPEYLSLLKLDIEGAEIEVLQTASDDTLIHIAQISVEFHDFLFSDKKVKKEITNLLTRMKRLNFSMIKISVKDYREVLFFNKKLIALNFTQKVRLNFIHPLLSVFKLTHISLGSIRTKIKNSLVFRIARIYKIILKSLPPKKFQPKNISQRSLVMLTGNSQLDLLDQSLLSIKRSFNIFPKIFLFIDRDLDINVCKRRLSWIPEVNLTIIPSQDCINYHLRKGNMLLSKFAGENPMGLKLAAILQISDETPLIYSDTDVLWFKDPHLFEQMIKEKDFKMALSLDFQASYDDNLIDKASLISLRQKPYYCAGIMFVKEVSVSTKAIIQELLQISTIKSNHFTEQTIFAYLNKFNGDFSLDATEFNLSTADRYDLLPSITAKTIARHYVGPVRHLFWRDALINRFKTKTSINCKRIS